MTHEHLIGRTCATIIFVPYAEHYCGVTFRATWQMQVQYLLSVGPHQLLREITGCLAPKCPTPLTS